MELSPAPAEDINKWDKFKPTENFDPHSLVDK